VDYLRSRMSKKDFEVLFHAMVIATASVTAIVGGALTLTGMVYCTFIKCGFGGGALTLTGMVIALLLSVALESRDCVKK